MDDDSRNAVCCVEMGSREELLAWMMILEMLSAVWRWVPERSH